MLIKRYLIILLALISISMHAVDIVPTPLEYETFSNGKFMLTDRTKIEVTEEILVDMAREFSYNIKHSTGIDLLNKKRAKQHIYLMIDPEFDNKEAYHLNVTNKRIEIYGGSQAGIFYGLQTLLQMFPEEIESDTVMMGVDWSVPIMAITDEPHNRHRTIFIDDSKHSVPTDSIKRILDIMSKLKLNSLYLYTTQLDPKDKLEIEEYASKLYVTVFQQENDDEGVRKRYSLKEIINSNIAGNNMNVWQGYINIQQMFAIAESSWVMPDLKDYEDFKRRMELLYKRIKGSSKEVN